MKRKVLLMALVTVLTVFTFVACSGNVTPEDKLGRISLGEDTSRAIGTAVTYSSDVENLYWYYKATKADDGFTTGQTDGYVAVVVDSKNDPVKGLSGNILNSKGFSYGLWNIELKGYASTDNSTAETEEKYTASLTNFLVEKEMNYATVEIKVGEGAETTIEFGDIWFSSSNITANSKFTLAVSDTPKGTVTVPTSTSDVVTEEGKVTFKNLTYSLTEGQVITGDHTMKFTLTQNLSGDNNIEIEAALYTLEFNVVKGTKTVISGDMLKNDQTGAIQVNGSLSVPSTTVKKVIPVDTDASEKVATVKTATSITVGDLTVTYPVGAKIVPGTGGLAGTDTDDVTSDGSVGFEYVGASNPTGTGITIETDESSAKYTLTLNAAKDADNANATLIKVEKYIGLNLDITTIYHGDTALTKLETLESTKTTGTEYYFYDSSSGVLTLFVFHASNFYIITKAPTLYVAQVGSTKYTNANAAFNAAKESGDSVTILENCTVERDELPNGVEFNLGKNTITKQYYKDGETSTLTEIKVSEFDGNSTALKYFAGGRGTKDEPYMISTAEEWNNTQYYYEYYYTKNTCYLKLKNDIDFEESVPFGYVYADFELDGNNCKIKGAKGPLFCQNYLCYNITIKDLTFQNCFSDYSLIDKYGSYVISDGITQTFRNVDAENCTANGGGLFLSWVRQDGGKMATVRFILCDIKESEITDKKGSSGGTAAFVGNSAKSVTLSGCTLKNSKVTAGCYTVAGMLGINGGEITYYRDEATSSQVNSSMDNVEVRLTNTSDCIYAVAASATINSTTTCTYTKILAVSGCKTMNNNGYTSVTVEKMLENISADDFEIDDDGNIRYSGKEVISKLKICQVLNLDYLMDQTGLQPAGTGGYPYKIEAEREFDNITADSTISNAVDYIKAVSNFTNIETVKNALDFVTETNQDLTFNNYGFAYKNGTVYVNTKMDGGDYSYYFSGTLKTKSLESINVTVRLSVYDSNGNLMGTLTKTYPVNLVKN